MNRLYIYDVNGYVSGTGSTNNPPISHSRWFISAESPEYFKDKKIVDGQIVLKSNTELAAIEAKDIEKHRNFIKEQAIRSISWARTKYITVLPGQDAIYQAKEAEAKSYLAELPTTLDNYPLLAAEVGVTAPNAVDLANLWLTMANNWKTIAAQLESIRMTTNAALNNATSKTELNNILDNLETTLAAL